MTPWTIQSMELSRTQYWSGYPLPSPGDLPNLGTEPRSLALQADSLPAEPLGSPRMGILEWIATTKMSSLSLLQQIFLTQESNWGLLHRRQILYQLSYQGNPIIYLTHPLLVGIYIVPNFWELENTWKETSSCWLSLWDWNCAEMISRLPIIFSKALCHPQSPPES